MKKEEQNGKKESKRTAKKAATLVLILVLVVLLLIAAGLMSGHDDPVTNYVRELLGRDAVSETVFEFDAYSDNIFEEMNGGLLVVSASAYQIFDEEGELIGGSTKAFSQPAISSGEGGAVLWSQNGTDALMVSPGGNTTAIDSQNTIIAAAVSDGGYAAVCTEESGYKGMVTVYDELAQPVYKWYSGSGYLVDAAVAPSGIGMLVLTLGEAGSRFLAYSFGSEAEQGSFVLEEDICFDVGYLSENRVCAISKDKAVFLNGSCEYNAAYSFGGQYLRDYSFDGSGFAVFVTGKYRTGGVTITAVAGDGDVLGSVESGDELRSLSVRGKYIAAAYADRVVLYNSAMEEVGVIEDAAGIEEVLARGDRSVIVVSGSKAVRYIF